MFSPKLTKVLFVGGLSALMGGTALATDTVEPVTSVMVPHVSGALGSPAPESAAQRTINLLPSTKYVNVEQSEIVKFSSGGETFTWNFDTLGTPNFDLAAIAPANMDVGKVRVYVGPNSLYFGSVEE